MKADSGTAGSASNDNKLQLKQATEYVAIVPVSDLFDFFKGNPMWPSYRSGGLEYRLTCEEDKFIFSAKEAAETTQPVLKITEAKFHLVNYDIDSVVREEILKMPVIAYGFNTYQVKSFLLTNGQNSLVWNVGDENVVGLKLIGRKTKSAESQLTGTVGTDYFRDLTRAADLKITSLEIKAGGQKVQDNPITTKNELYQYTKAYFLQQQDTDIGGMITRYNWDTEVPSLSEAQSDHKTTHSQHINIPLNINGQLSGWDCRSNPLEIVINTGVATADLVYLDVYAISSRVATESYGKVSVWH